MVLVEDGASSTTQSQSSNSAGNAAANQPTVAIQTDRAMANTPEPSRPGAFRVDGVAANDNININNNNTAQQRDAQLTEEEVRVLGNLGIPCVNDAVAVPILDTDCEVAADATGDRDIVDGIPVTVADERERKRKLKRHLILTLVPTTIIGIIIIVAVVLVKGGAKDTVVGGGVGEVGEEDVVEVQAEQYYDPTIVQVRKEGILRCGTSALYAFGGLLNDDTGEWEGMGADLCKAVAAAILGDQYEIDMTHVTSVTRFTALEGREVDILMQGDTHTMERDFHEKTTGVGFKFTDPYFYGGLGFAGQPFFSQCADSFSDCKSTGSCSSVSQCGDLKICTYAESSHVPILQDIFPSTNIVPITIIENQDEFTQSFVDGNCNVLAGEALSISEAAARAAGYNGDYAYSKSILSKEPLAMVTRKNDQLGHAANLVLRSLIHAEVANITQANADELNIGDTSGLDLISAIRAVGNYGEIYARNMEAYVPRQDINLLYSANVNNESGLHYSHPTGDIKYFSHEFAADSTIHQILEREFLICGVIGDAKQSIETDYCRALSASLFSGDPNLVDIVKLSPEEDDLITKLDSGEVDVIAGASVLYSSRTDPEDLNVTALRLSPGLAFTQPYYFDGSSPPRAMATSENDSDWSAFVYWVSASLVKAEEEGITSTNFGGRVPDIGLFGPKFEWMFRGPIVAVGNYGEIYERNNATLSPRANQNLLNNGGPLLADKL